MVNIVTTGSLKLNIMAGGQSEELWNVKLVVNIVTTGSLKLNIMAVSDIRRSTCITWLEHCASALDTSRYQLLPYL